MPISAAAATPLSPDLERLDDALVRIRRMLQRPGYRRRLRSALPVDVELTTLRVLRAVERAGKAAPSIGEVAGALGVDPSSASRFVEQASAAGFLERRVCSSDRRRSRLHLTATGRDLLLTATRARQALLADVTAGWSTTDVEALGVLLERLRIGFDELEGEA